MDSAGLLDLLGNENRRRILRLLARKPCYVTEIGEYLGVSPKAVIDHLRKLEEAGLVESTTDEARRKYFHIARNLRLEVNVSPYGFATKSAYAASPGLDLRTCRYVSIDVQVDRQDDLGKLASELDALQEVEHELSLAQRWVQGRLTDVLDRLSERLEEDVDGRGRLYAEVLAALAGETRTAAAVAADVDADEAVVAEALDALTDAGVVERREDGWQIAG